MNKLFVISVFFILIYSLSAACAMDVNETCDSIPADIENELRLSCDSCNVSDDVDESSADVSFDNAEDKLAVGDMDDEKLSSAKYDSISNIDKNPVTVNPDNFFDYFDKLGVLKPGNSELIFEGNFKNMGINKIIIIDPVSISGNNAVFNDIAICIHSDNVSVKNLVFDYTYQNSYEDYVINAHESSNFVLEDNKISYYAEYDGGYHRRSAVYIDSCSSVIIRNNKCKASLPASTKVIITDFGDARDIKMDNEAIAVLNSKHVIFDSNAVDVTLNHISEYEIKMFSVHFSCVSDAVITNNEINTYSKGLAQCLVLSGGDYIVKSNKLYAYSDMGAVCIEIFCQTRGVIEYNNIYFNSKLASYGVKSSEFSRCCMNYTGNNVEGNGDYIFAFSLTGVGDVISNTVNVDGNYSTGLAFYGEKLNVSNNRFNLKSNEIGNTIPYQRLIIEAVGIKLLSGKITVLNNYISTPGKGISIGTNRVLVRENNTYYLDYTNTTKSGVYYAPCDSNMEVYLADNNINVLSGDGIDVHGILDVAGNVTYKNNIINMENQTSPMDSYDVEDDGVITISV